jgi:PAS domain S-box-containing protein
MAIRTQLKRPIYNEDEHYEVSTRMIRWICLALVLITYPSDQPYSLAMFTLILVTACYNWARYNKRLLRHPGFASRANSLAVDHIFVLVLVFLSGGLASPYYPFFFLLIIGTIASYGIAGFAMSLAGQLVVTPMLMTVKNAALPAAPEFQFIVKIIFLIVFSLVAEQSVRSRDEEKLLEGRFTRQVENERQRLLALINSLSTAVLAVNERGKIYLYNAAALELLNTNQDISGRSVNDFLPLHDPKYASFDLFEYMRQQRTVCNRQDLVFVPNDGSEMVLDLTISPIHIPGNDKSGGYIVVFRDITKQKSLDEERDEFISVTSHELRTPLAIAEANISTALLPGFAKIEPKAANLLYQAHENILFLSALIKDLATLSRAERGVLKSDKTVVNLSELLTGLCRDYRPQAKAKGLELKSVIAGQTHNVVTSESELREIIQNFLTNAIKYTNKGSVTLTLEHHRDAAQVSVRDTGIGVSASDKAKIFTKFFRSEDYRTRSTGGTGLGLYITKKLAEHLGMKLEFTSRLNHGSTFTLTIPYHDPAIEAQTAKQLAAQDDAENKITLVN